MANKKYNKRLINKFIQVFLTTFVLLMIVIGIGTMIYVVVSQQNISKPALGATDFSSTEYPEGKVIVDGEAVDNPLGDKKMTTIAVFGVDEAGYRTDVNMIVFFNHETAKVDILSVPRDTQVKIPDEIYEQIQSRRSDVNQIIKINEVPAYVIDDRNETSVAVLEKTLGVDIDYYVNMDLSVFRFIVDQIGEIKVTIPIDMKYSDPDNGEDGLFIDFEAGEHLLNGAQAEKLIRFRSGYGTGDIGRIGMQHEFMKSFVEQLLTTTNRLNMVNIVAGIMVRVDTNFNNAVDYLIYLDQIEPENFEMHMLPGEADNSTRSYYIYDYDETKALLDEIINEPYSDVIAGSGDEQVAGDTEDSTGKETLEPVVDVKPETIIDVKSMVISVRNGTNTSGFAGKIQTKLNDEGYNGFEAINNDEKGILRTQLIVPAEEVFEELKVFFADPEMVIAPAMMDAEIQVIVVLGQNDVEE